MTAAAATAAAAAGDATRSLKVALVVVVRCALSGGCVNCDGVALTSRLEVCASRIKRSAAAQGINQRARFAQSNIVVTLVDSHLTTAPFNIVKRATHSIRLPL